MLNNKQQSARPTLGKAATLATLFFLFACSPAPEEGTAAETAAPGKASLSVELVAVETGCEW